MLSAERARKNVDAYYVVKSTFNKIKLINDISRKIDRLSRKGYRTLRINKKWWKSRDLEIERLTFIKEMCDVWEYHTELTNSGEYGVYLLIWW